MGENACNALVNLIFMCNTIIISNNFMVVWFWLNVKRQLFVGNIFTITCMYNRLAFHKHFLQFFMSKQVLY